MANRRRGTNEAADAVHTAAMSEVRGPTSALTSFLKSKNIRVQNTNRYRRRDDASATPVLENGRQASEGQAPTPPGSTRASASATPMPDRRSASTSVVPDAGPSVAARRPPVRPKNSMSFAEDDESDEEGPISLSSASKRSRMAVDEDDKEDGKPDSVPASPSPAVAPPGQHSRRLTANGAIDFCATCAKRFTITGYTKHTPAGGLCHRCGPLYGNAASQSAGRSLLTDLDSAAASQPVTKKAKGRSKPKQHDFDKLRLPTLQAMCINIISENIEDTEALLGVNLHHIDGISKSISKNRRLNSQTAMLFLQPQVKRLAFYDCSKLDSDVLASIPRFCPYLEEINLQLCGMLDNAAFDAWTTRLSKLHSVELYGPFLVRVEAWHRFFTAIGPRLTSFKIRETPRFDKSCCEKLVECCPNVTELGLAQIGPLNAVCLDILIAYGHQLTYLDISDPGVSAPGVPPVGLKDDEVIRMLTSCGQRLQHLNISRNADLTSRTLLEGILANCLSLQSLSMTMLQAEDIEAAHFTALFKGMKERGGARLNEVNLERCLAIDDDAIEALVDFSGEHITTLNLNSCDAITPEGFARIADGCRNLHTLDVSFCRKVDDEVLMNLINKIRALRIVSVFSCNKVTPFVRGNDVRIYGKEKYA